MTVLETGPTGLTPDEAAIRLVRDGPNRLPMVRAVPPWRKLVAQLVHFFALMLWVASVLAVVAGLPQLGVAIAVVVVVNGVFAFVQEHQAERAAEKLRDLLPREVSVIRGGRNVQIDAAELVVGDLVVLTGGDRISADLDVVLARSLKVDTSMMTGESVPVTLEAGERALAGTFVTEGEGQGVVAATGARTRLAGIAELTRVEPHAKTPMARQLAFVVRRIALMAVVVGVLAFAAALALGSKASNGFLFAVGVTVALVPEGLLPTVTMSLAYAAQRMADRHALVRRLDAVEALGATTFICTDKTGTLTRNEMTVVEVWTPRGTVGIDGNGYEPRVHLNGSGLTQHDVAAVALAAARCSEGRAVLRDGRWQSLGDPMEAAIDVLARGLGMDRVADDRDVAIDARYPFDPRRRRMSVVADGTIFVKGAPDAVFPVCTDPELADRAGAALATMASRGLRVLAVASRPAPESFLSANPDADAVETSLELLGLLGFEDPPRPSSAASVAACRRAGIRLAMVTGDHPATAAAIAREVGLLGAHELVVEGKDLPSDEAALGELLDRDGAVIARVDPEDKVRIARALQSRGHVVAMTGDGVNDGPALQAADVGVAMGRSGTDVAREAADLVLLDDDFGTIVAAVEQGRATFLNIRRFLTYHLTDNVAELTPFVVWALSGGRFPLAIGVLQVLALDIGTDLLPALALGAEPPRAGLLDRPPPAGALLDRGVVRRAFGVLGPAEAVMEMLAFVVALVAGGWWIGEPFPEGHRLYIASGAAFSAVVLGQMANAYACRSSTQWPGTLGWMTNRLLGVAVLVELVALGGFLFVGPVARVLEHAGPPLAGAAVAVLTGPVVLAVDALDKRRRRHRAAMASR